MRLQVWIVGIVLLAPGVINAGLLPGYEDVLTTESAHFRFIFQASLQERMPELIKNFEDAYTALNPVLHWTPAEKITVLFSDALDTQNGWTTVYPHPTIFIYAADAEPGSTIYQPGNYLRRTIFHEYTHLLSLDSQYGVDKVLTDIFGHVLPVASDPLSVLITLFSASPGTLSPDWYQEGLATWVETEFVGLGRGRNSLADMVMRMATKDNRLLHPVQWNTRYPTWPYGSVVYLYGVKTMQHAQEKYGTGEVERNIPGELSDAVSHSFAFSFNRRARSVVRQKFSQLANEAMVAERARQSARIQELETYPVTAIPRVTPPDIVATQPVFGPQGRFIYFSGGPEAARDTLYRYDRHTNTTTKLSSARTSIRFSGVTASPDRQAVYYTRLNVTGNNRLWNELYRYDVTTGRRSAVTRTGRYRYPTIHPNGTTMAAVRVAAGLQHLVEVPLDRAGDPKAERLLVQSAAQRSLVDPVYSPDGRFLLYISANETGSTLRQITLATGEDTRLLHWEGIIIAPAFHPSGESVVFSADRNGVYNLYRLPFPADAAASAVPITHVMGGMFAPDFSLDGSHLTAVGYDARGFYLTVLEMRTLQPLVFPLPQLEADWPAGAANQQAMEATNATPPPPLHALDIRPYNSLSGLGFDFWSPWLTVFGDDVAGGVAASFSDPTQNQQLFALAGAESEFGTPIGFGAYRFSGWRPTWTIFGRHTVQSYDNLVVDTNDNFFDYDETVGEIGTAATFDWLRADWHSQLTLGYLYTERHVIEDSADVYEDQALRTEELFEGRESAFWARVVFFNPTVFPRSHSLEDGRYVSVVADGATEAFGGELDRVRVRGDGAEYISMPWGRNHVLKLEVAAGTSFGDDTAQGAFGLGGVGGLPLADGLGVSRNVWLRGYRENTQVGEHVIKAGVAYRFPVFSLYHGVTPTLPWYLHQGFLEVFYEGGTAWSGERRPDEKDWINSFGVEFNVSMTFFRFFDIAPGLGVAYVPERDEQRFGDDEDDTVQVFLALKSTVNF